jgi:subtilisin family serine protease
MTTESVVQGNRLRGCTVKKALLASLASFLALVGIAAGASAQSSPAQQHIFVGFKNTPGASERALVQRYGGAVRFAFPSVKALAIDIAGDKVGEIAREGSVRYVEQDSVREPSSLTTSQLTPSLTNGLYGLVTTHAVDAHAAGATGAGVKACVADTGLDTTHPDIAPNFVAGHDSFDGDGNVDVFHDGVADTETHGTHVAGTLLAANNAVGVLGVAYDADLYHARVLGTHEHPADRVSGTTSQVMDGVQWLAGQGCKVVNLSLGGSQRSRTEQALYEQLYAQGTLIVAASGNDGRSTPHFPSGYEVVVSVGAVDETNTIADFSNTGSTLDLVGPGVQVLSSVPAGKGFESSASGGGSTYRAFGMEFAGSTSSSGFTATLVNCGLAKAPSDCVDEPGDGSWIAVIQRGDNTFAQKVENAMAAGAGAAIIYNNVAGDFLGTLGSETPSGGGSWIPAVSVSDTAGAALVAAAGTTGNVLNVISSWDYFDGTSMATPHVSGVAALIFGENPSLTPAQVESILKNTALDLGTSGSDTTYGFGLVQADDAVAATP